MTDQRRNLSDVKQLIERGEHASALARLASCITPKDDFVTQSRAAKLCSRLAHADLGLRPIKVALLASSTVDHLADVLRYWLALEGFAAEIWVAPFDTIAPTVLDQESELYAFRPDVVWLFTSYRDVRVPTGDDADGQEAVRLAVDSYASLWNVLLARLNCIVLQNNADIPADDSFGNYAGQNPSSRRNALRAFNLMLASDAPAGVALVDLDHVSALFGKARWVDRRYWYHSKHAFSLDACGTVAFQAARLMSAAKGRARKCLVLDLDNTLWGGVIGDDGLAGIKLGNGVDGEAFVDFQHYVAALKERGIILAVCSKNDETNAREPFEKHPNSVLKLTDFAAFVANWSNKADNLQAIAETLNIGLDALVFVDDNPVERNLVREFLPMVAVPELPEDPSGYIAALDEQRYFETASYSAEDRQRSRYYQENAVRTALKGRFRDTGEYLRSLEMVCESEDLDAFHLPRMAQLINKSNQFHLTGTRYSEAELRALAGDPRHRVRYYKLRDKFGDNGLIAVLVLAVDPHCDELFIDTWVMSCRVLGRTMEAFICNDVVAIAREASCGAVVGRYVRSAKNKLVSKLYDELGFAKNGESNSDTTTWRLALVDRADALVTHVNPAAELRHAVA
jgi:FkbH-like protein